MQKQIVLNEEYQNQLKLEIEQQQPFISELLPLSALQAEYEGSFAACFSELAQTFAQVRRLRRDGNCFYRAYLFQVFEHFIQVTGTLEAPTQNPAYEEFLAAVEKSKADLMALGYDEIAIEDFHDVFLTETKKLREVEPAKAQEHLMKLLCNKEEAVYLIMYARFITACYLKQNSFLFEDFVGDVASFCMREVEAVDVECDHPQIIAITNYLGIGVRINSIGPKGNLEVINLPEDEAFDKKGFRASLLYVPGHYEALYK